MLTSLQCPLLQAALILTSALLTPPTPGPTALTSRPPAPTLWAAGPAHVKQVSREMIRNLEAPADQYIQDMATMRPTRAV